MFTYVVRRLAFALLLVFAASSAALLLARLAPGDYVAVNLGLQVRQTTVAQERARLGLDRPMLEQYGGWIARAIRFDFGRSLLYDAPVSELIRERAVNTAVLATTSLAVATCIGLPLGVVTGSRREGLLAGLIRAGSLVLLSMPPLLTSLILVVIAARTGWFPIGGMHSAVDVGSPIADVLWHLVVPAAALALPIAAMFERLESQAMADVIGEPHVLASLARGVPRRRVVWRSALKNSLRPVAAIYGLVVGTLLSGSFAVEMVTSWPGLGQLMLEALRARDVYLVAGCAATGSVLLAFGTLISDAALAAVDPRTAG